MGEVVVAVVVVVFLTLGSILLTESSPNATTLPELPANRPLRPLTDHLVDSWPSPMIVGDAILTPRTFDLLRKRRSGPEFEGAFDYTAPA